MDIRFLESLTWWVNRSAAELKQCSGSHAFQEHPPRPPPRPPSLTIKCVGISAIATSHPAGPCEPMRTDMRAPCGRGSAGAAVRGRRRAVKRGRKGVSSAEMCHTAPVSLLPV